jgi:hypothetical protein
MMESTTFALTPMQSWYCTSAVLSKQTMQLSGILKDLTKAYYFYVAASQYDKEKNNNF